MTETIRFHLDENMNPVIAHGLRQRGIDVTTCQESELLGMSDLDQLAYAFREKRVIVTQDADFLMIASQTTAHYGIAYAGKKMRNIGQIIQALELMHSVMMAEEMVGHIEYL